jgi:hypothetical protein
MPVAAMRDKTIIEDMNMDAAVTLITGAVDFDTVVTGVGTIAAAVAVVYVVVKGARMLLTMIRGA